MGDTVKEINALKILLDIVSMNKTSGWKSMTFAWHAFLRVA